MFLVKTIDATTPEVYCCCKWLQFCDGKYAEETLATAEVIIPNGCVVLLASCVKNVNLHLLSIQHHFLPVTVCFSGLIVFNKLEEGEKKKQLLLIMFKSSPLRLICGTAAET